ncbi:TetR/AcrR family transcriptional regulator [Actinocorallia aurea]
MEQPQPVPVDASGWESLLERAYADAVEQVDEADESQRRILDGALEQFARSGIQRSTMEDVARRAGLSRMTVYRRFATKEALVAHLVRREFRRYFARFLRDIAEAETVADRVVLGFVSSLRAVLGNPLIGGLIDSEPDVIVSSMVRDEGRTLAVVRQFVADQLRREQGAGHVRADLNVDVAAELMVRISASFLAIPTLLPGLDQDDQLAAMAREFIVPMLNPPPDPGIQDRRY